MMALIRALVLESLDEGTRVHLLINQVGGLIPNALWLAVLFWSFDVGVAGWSFDVGAASLCVSPMLLGALIVLFVIPVFLAFLIGGQRAKHWRSSLMAKQQQWIARLRDVLEVPVGSLYVPRLTDLRTTLDAEIAGFIEGDPVISFAAQVDQGMTPPELKSFVPAYELSRDSDQRFRHLVWLRETSTTLGMIIDDLSKLTKDAAWEKSAKEWVHYLQPREEALKKEHEVARKTRTPVVIIGSLVLLPILNVVVTAAGKLLWAYYTKSPPQ
jgi:hypothetical protein